MAFRISFFSAYEAFTTTVTSCNHRSNKNQKCILYFCNLLFAYVRAWLHMCFSLLSQNKVLACLDCSVRARLRSQLWQMCPLWWSTSVGLTHSSPLTSNPQRTATEEKVKSHHNPTNCLKWQLVGIKWKTFICMFLWQYKVWQSFPPLCVVWIL